MLDDVTPSADDPGKNKLVFKTKDVHSLCVSEASEASIKSDLSVTKELPLLVDKIKPRGWSPLGASDIQVSEVSQVTDMSFISTMDDQSTDFSQSIVLTNKSSLTSPSRSYSRSASHSTKSGKSINDSHNKIHKQAFPKPPQARDKNKLSVVKKSPRSKKSDEDQHDMRARIKKVYEKKFHASKQKMNEILGKAKAKTLKYKKKNKQFNAYIEDMKSRLASFEEEITTLRNLLTAKQVEIDKFPEITRKLTLKIIDLKRMQRKSMLVADEKKEKKYARKE